MRAEFDLTLSIRVRVAAETMTKARSRAKPAVEEIARCLPPGTILIGNEKSAFIRKVER